MFENRMFRRVIVGMLGRKEEKEIGMVVVRTNKPKKIHLFVRLWGAGGKHVSDKYTQLFN